MGFFSSIVNRFIPPVVGKAIAKFVPFLSPILSFVSIVSTALTWLRKPDEPEFNFDIRFRYRRTHRLLYVQCIRVFF